MNRNSNEINDLPRPPPRQCWVWVPSLIALKTGGPLKAQKELDQDRQAAAQQAEQYRARFEALQQERAQLIQKLGVTEGALTETRSGRDVLRRQLERALAAKAAGPARKRASSKA